MSDTKPEHVSSSLGAIHAAALAQAKKWNLVCDNGQIVCLRDGCGQEATLPSLLCQGHLASFRKGYR